MDREQFLLNRIAEREAAWAGSRSPRDDNDDLSARVFAACEEDRKRVKEAGPNRRNAYVDKMLLAYHDHPDFKPSWHPLFTQADQPRGG